MADHSTTQRLSDEEIISIAETYCDWHNRRSDRSLRGFGFEQANVVAFARALLSRSHSGEADARYAARCMCETCTPHSVFMRMILCPKCGNKRCPHATFHGNACTNSNEPGQPGSSHPKFASEGRKD